jgi:hypothetical protein
MIGPILLIIYIALSGTLGAWWLASLDITKDEIDLLDVLRLVIPAVMTCWFIVPIYLLNNIKIKKFK